jgi:uncharacterized protein YejL (UPF0352 family)
MKDKLLGIKSEMHRVLKKHLDSSGLSLMQQVVLIEDMGTALTNRIAVFVSHNQSNGHKQESEVKTEEPMMLQRSYD